MMEISYKRTINYSESDEQCSFMQELSLRNKEAWESTWWTPNERKVSAHIGAKYKRMGRKAGVPDIFMAIPIGVHHGLFIEMKRKELKGKKSTTDNQDIMSERLSKNGYLCRVCFGAQEAIDCAMNYLREDNHE